MTDEEEDWLLANLPEFVEGMAAADAELAAGRTRSLEEVFARLAAAEDEPQQPPASGVATSG